MTECQTVRPWKWCVSALQIVNAHCVQHVNVFGTQHCSFINVSWSRHLLQLCSGWVKHNVRTRMCLHSPYFSSNNDLFGRQVEAFLWWGFLAISSPATQISKRQRANTLFWAIVVYILNCIETIQTVSIKTGVAWKVLRHVIHPSIAAGA